MPYGVTVADVENRWRPLQPAEASVASYIIGDLLNDLALHRPALAILVNGLEASINPEDHAQAEALKRVITKVLAYAVKRILRNPEAMRNMNIGADGSIGIGYDNDLEALQGVELTRDEFADIDAIIDRSKRVLDQVTAGTRPEAPSRPAIAVGDLVIRDPDWDERDRLSQWLAIGLIIAASVGVILTDPAAAGQIAEDGAPAP